MNSLWKGVVLLNHDQYSTLKKEGRITVDGVEYFFDEDWTYVTPTTLQPPILSEYSPTEETEGEIGQIYVDTSAQKMYFCTKINNVTTETGEEIKQYIWIVPGADVDVSNLVTIDQVKPLVGISDNGVILGVGAEGRGVVIGTNAYSYNTSDKNIAIGKQAQTRNQGNLYGSIAIGQGAQTTADKCVQFGNGTNTKTETLKIFSDNIYNFGTHTLTVQNIELNGVNLITKFLDLDTEQTVTGVKTFANTIYQLDADGNSVEIVNKNDLVDALSAVTDVALSDDSKTLTVTKRDGTTFDFQGGGGGTLVYVNGAVQESISVNADLQGQLDALNQEVTTIKSTIPTNNNQLTNGAGYITSSGLSNYVTINTAQTITGVKTFGEIHATAIYLD